MLTIKTKFGELYAKPNNGNDVYLDNRSHDHNTPNLPALKINGVEYNMSAHLCRHEDGHWRVGYEKENNGKVRPEWERRQYTIYGHRANTILGDLTTKARAVFFEELETIADQWASQNVKALEQAELGDIAEEIEKKANELKEMQDKVEAITKELVALQHKLDQQTIVVAKAS